MSFATNPKHITTARLSNPSTEQSRANLNTEFYQQTTITTTTTTNKMASKTGTAILLPENEEQARLQNMKAQGQQQQQQQQPDSEWDTEEMLSMGIDNEGHPVPEDNDTEPLPKGSHHHPENTDLYGAMTEEF